MKRINTVEELIDSLDVWHDVEAAFEEIRNLEKETTKNYEVMAVPDQEESYVISESRYWEVLVRKGYHFVKREG